MRKPGIQHPARLVPLAFLAIILIGTALLMLPGSRAGAGSAPFLTALFTSTSAVCVTGLIVVDTPTYWSGFGQTVILLLFQVGGFGIMTGATLLGLLIAGRLNLGVRLLAQAETRLGLGEVGGVVKVVLQATLIIEALAAALLTVRLHYGYGEPWGEALWDGVFQAVSAFNNAGFATYSDNLMGFATDPWILLPIMLAVVLGGLGFPVLYELRHRSLHYGRWSVHTKITLWGSALLLAGGMLMIWAYEWHNPATLGQHDTGGKWLGALFHSVVARTAGFNTMDIGAMMVESQVVTWALMFIGGGSASTAGGIKVTTFFLLGFAVWAELRGSHDTYAFHRRIPQETMRQALTVVLMALTLLALGVLALLSATDFPVHDVIFEVISAAFTVGLSTGITADLPPDAQYVVIVLMYMGRVGFVTVASVLALRSHRLLYRYPEERPIVG